MIPLVNAILSPPLKPVICTAFVLVGAPRIKVCGEPAPNAMVWLDEIEPSICNVAPEAMANTPDPATGPVISSFPPVEFGA